jgi:hypothetical protein
MEVEIQKTYGRFLGMIFSKNLQPMLVFEMQMVTA